MPRPRLLDLLAALSLATALAVGIAPARAADLHAPPAAWPQFRGPDGQGHANGILPTSWSESQHKFWSIDVPGKGWSSPVIMDGQVWLTTAIPAQPAGFSLRALAFDEHTGKLLHDVPLFFLAKADTLHPRNGLATPTPILEHGRLYAHFGRYGTACVDTRTGKILWKNTALVINHETGPASSPALYKDRLICAYDGSDLQFAAALSTQTGQVLWRTDRPIAAELKKQAESRRAFSTPLVITVGGNDQVVIPGAFCVYSYDPMTGRELWRVRYGGFSNVPRPVFANGLVIVSSGFAPPVFLAIRPDGQGDVTKTHVAWRYRKNVPNVPSPVVVGDRFYMVSDSGIATCLDAKTGKLVWSERLGGGFGASLVASGKTIYAFDDSGKTTLFAAADVFKELGRNELKGKVQATPAASGGCLFVRTDGRLIKVGIR